MRRPAPSLRSLRKTLFDVHSVTRGAAAIRATRKPVALCAEQLEYRGSADHGKHVDFWEGPGGVVLEHPAGGLSPARPRPRVWRLSSLAPPDCSPQWSGWGGETRHPFEGLRDAGGGGASSGLEGTFAHVLSVDAVRVYKPSPRVYELGPRAFGLAAREILFVSSNAWDIAGAAAFGYRTCWCNRQGAPMEDLGFTPDHEVERLEQIPERVEI